MCFIYLPLTLWLWKAPYTGHRRRAQGTPQRRGMSLKDAVVIFRDVAGNRTITSMILLAGLSALFVGTAFQALMPEYAHDLGTDEAGLEYSALLGANAAGAVVGGILLEGRGLAAAPPANGDYLHDPMVSGHYRLRRRHKLPTSPWCCFFLPGFST